jgi:hypothetical protein
VQIKNDGKIEPTLGSQYIGDIIGPFLVRSSGNKIAVQPVRSDAKTMITVGGDLMLAGANQPDPVDPSAATPTSCFSVYLNMKAG